YHKNNHRYAIDFNPTDEEENIYAIAPGRVVYAQFAQSGYGNTVVIEHHDANIIGDDGYYYSQYSHLSEYDVNVGDIIKPDHSSCDTNQKGFNCPIGREGNTGGNFGIHLHFELHRCDSPFVDISYSECKNVIPEPMIGAQVYEGLTWLYVNAPREEKYYPISWRPNDYNADNTSPSGSWGISTSNGDIYLLKPIVWDIEYPLWEKIKEIRATIYYFDWPFNDLNKTDVLNKYHDFDPKKVWYIVGACNPTINAECQHGHWHLEWNPWTENNSNSPIPVGWLPKNVAPTSSVSACISFDIFDEYGNVSYAPGGVEGSACAQLFNQSSPNQNTIQSFNENSPYRLVKLIPQSNVSSDEATLISQTLSDYAVVSAGQSSQQTWQIRNSGNSTWGTGYKLVFREGDQMGAPHSIDIPSTSPGETVKITIPFQAPSQEKAYASRWQLQNSQGTYFGPALWIKIKVINGLLTEHITLFDISPASPSDATSVHIVGRTRYFADYRSMRFRIGDQILEQPNLIQIGDQLQISTDWQTASLERGTYAIVFEVAKKGDNEWVNPERIVKTYTLIGSPISKNRPPDRPLLKSPYNWFLKDSSGSPAAVELCVFPVNDPDGNAVKYYFEVKDQGGGVYANSGW
ncbi:MAG: NBR1-Ig-like domain-containing protein, partial [Candidatus Kryptoniota bacterium]